jgi:hypothetical protein
VSSICRNRNAADIKFEARNPKFETDSKPKIQMTKTDPANGTRGLGKRRHPRREAKHAPSSGSAIRSRACLRFEHSCFEFWICFGFRDSDLGFLKMRERRTEVAA